MKQLTVLIAKASFGIDMTGCVVYARRGHDQLHQTGCLGGYRRDLQ